MSAVSNRKWEYWIKKSYFESDYCDNGIFECIVIPTMMASQTVEFVTENFNMFLDGIVASRQTERKSIEINMTSDEGCLCIKIRGFLHTKSNLHEVINTILKKIDAISICVDYTLECNRIDFISDYRGKVLSASRQSIGRGLAFEVEERQLAKNKINTDIEFYENASPELEVGIQHYLTGMTLLGLEDQLSGLTDAAFMQFFQGCEAISGSDGKTEGICRHIASHGFSDSETLQIIAHHIYQVRNKYFGHGDIKHNIKAIKDYETAYKITKQVLVVRYLCKRLIDMDAPSGKCLIREMRFYSDTGSEEFRGTVEELKDAFYAEYPGRTAKIYDGTGKKIKEYQI